MPFSYYIRRQLAGGKNLSGLSSQHQLVRIRVYDFENFRNVPVEARFSLIVVCPTSQYKYSRNTYPCACFLAEKESFHGVRQLKIGTDCISLSQLRTGKKNWNFFSCGFSLRSRCQIKKIYITGLQLESASKDTHARVHLRVYMCRYYELITKAHPRLDFFLSAPAQTGTTLQIKLDNTEREKEKSGLFFLSGRRKKIKFLV